MDSKQEKVINGLKCKLGLLANHNCGDCQYGLLNGRGEWDCSPPSIAEDALDLLEAQKSRVMTLDEVRRLTYGSPYIIETNLQKEEPRLMYGLFSHLGMQDNFTFAFTDGRGYLFDKDYGKRWRCWTSRPTDTQREATPWES